MNDFQEYSYLFSKLSLLAVKIDFDRDRVMVIANTFRPEENGQEYAWRTYTITCLNGLFSSNPSVRSKIRSGALKELALTGAFTGKFPTREMEILHSKDPSAVYRLNLSFKKEEDGRIYAYLTLRNDSDQSLLQSIVQTLVFNNCDYFVTVDIRSGVYTMLAASNNGTPLPPVSGDYDVEIIKYAKQYVVYDDQQLVINEMTLKNCVEHLKGRSSYSIFFGMVEDGTPVDAENVRESSGYHRKKIEFSYFDDRTRDTLLLVRTDITYDFHQELQKVRRLQEMLQRAYTDALTGLLNHEGMAEQCQIQLNAARSDEKIALLFIDLDNFKPVNDTFGHPAGDEVLKQVGRLLKLELRAADDLSGRIGGDEFVVMIGHLKDRMHAVNVAERIRQGIEKIGAGTGKERISVSCSVGIAYNNEGQNLYADMVALADRRVYRAKALGKGCVVNEDPDHD